MLYTNSSGNGHIKIHAHNIGRWGGGGGGEGLLDKSISTFCLAL